MNAKPEAARCVVRVVNGEKDSGRKNKGKRECVVNPGWENLQGLEHAGLSRSFKEFRFSPLEPAGTIGGFEAKK